MAKGLALLEGAAFGAAFAGGVLAAAAYANTFRLAFAIVIINAVVGLAVDRGFRGRGGIAGNGVRAPLRALLKGFAAGLAAAPGPGTLHLDAGQVAEIVAVVQAGGYRTFQSVFHGKYLGS